METASRNIWVLRLREDPLIRSIVATVGLILLVGFAVLLMGDAGWISLSYINHRLPYFLHLGGGWQSFTVAGTQIAYLVQYPVGPITLSLGATMISFVIGFGLAIPMGMLRAFGPNLIRAGGGRSLVVRPLYYFVTGYDEAMRGTPAFVQILLISAVIERVLPATTPNIEFWAGTLALTINTIGYQSEVFRAGFQSVGQGQIEAAKSIGMTPLRTFLHITLPQGLRLIVLPLTNEWIGLFKASALLYYIAVQEAMWAAFHLSYIDVKPVEAFLMVSFYYLLIMVPLSKVITYVEKKKRIPGLGTVEPVRKRWVRPGARAPSAVVAVR